jgi:subtilase family serine protease
MNFPRGDPSALRALFGFGGAVTNPLAPKIRSPLRQRCARLCVEELESRDLLSAGDPVVQPLLAVEPFALNGQTPYTPAQIAHAYGFDQIAFTSSGGQSIRGDGTGQTIAIVEMYDDPAIASDLHVFDQRFGMGDPRLIKAAPDGTPGVNTLWAMETALDVEWAHAMAPRATILLVEARGTTVSLLHAVDYARHYPGVSVVSMSWGDPEFGDESWYDSYFTTPAGHTPVTFIASAGDYGAASGPYWPAISPNVLGVGGTTLYLSSTGNWAGETGWSGSTGGYSGYRLHYASYVHEPAYQYAVQRSGYRSAPDVAYDANRNTGYLIYDSVGSYGWIGVGGTSAGSPQWAALAAIADQGRALAGKSALASLQAEVYSLPASDFHDVRSGSNGYSAHAGYDLVTGLGTPIANRIVHDLAGAEGAGAGGSGSTTTTGLTVSVSIPVFTAAVVVDEHAERTLAAFDSGEWRRLIESILGWRAQRRLKVATTDL